LATAAWASSVGCESQRLSTKERLSLASDAASDGTRTVVIDERSVIGQHASNRVDFGGFQRFVQVEWGQDGGQAAGQHGFACARRTDEDDVVSTCCGQFQGAFDVFLAAHIAEV
jgi:hypothetical protein